MPFAEYATVPYRESRRQREHDTRSKWAYRVSSKPASFADLEEEILFLRRKMELAASRGRSLTAPEVIEISEKLDLVLNEYMRAEARA